MNLERTTEDEVLRGWAAAESGNPTRWNDLGGHLAIETARRVRVGAALSEVDWQELVRAIKRFRAPILERLPTGVTWYRAGLSLEDVAAVQIMPLDKFRSAGPAYTVRSLALAVETEETIDDPPFISNVTTLRAGFDVAQVELTVVNEFYP